MNSTTSATPLVQSGSALYMFHYGEYEDRTTCGPYIGASGLDFDALKEDYRRDRYAEAEAAQEDCCSLDEGGFVTWLRAKGLISPVETSDVHLEVRTSFDSAYVPKHWPECPECRTGRGEQEYGNVRRSLNRIVSYRRCTECRHEWGHEDVPNNSREPMLDDDGRDTDGGCVPFAISKACGLPWETVQAVCREHGWTHHGMRTDYAMVAARKMGFEITLKRQWGPGAFGQPTIKRLLGELPHGRNYIVGVKDHWIAIVGGRIVDNETNSSPARKVLELYEVSSVRA